MSQKEKLLRRLLSLPVDFTWEELVKLLGYYGYAQRANGKTGGSRSAFYKDGNIPIKMHRPHGGDAFIKEYALKAVIEHLKEAGEIE